jgi:hypothetical protein
MGHGKKSDEKVSFGKRAMEICDREKKNEKLTLSFSPNFKFKICQSSIDLNKSEF